MYLIKDPLHHFWMTVVETIMIMKSLIIVQKTVAKALAKAM